MIRIGDKNHTSLVEEEDQWDHSNSTSRRRNSLKLVVIPLYASLTPQSQKLAFKSVHSSIRKCVVATNIAETSVTVPGIRFIMIYLHYNYLLNNIFYFTLI